MDGLMKRYNDNGYLIVHTWSVSTSSLTIDTIEVHAKYLNECDRIEYTY